MTGSIRITTDLVQDLVKSQFPEYSHLEIRAVETSGWDNRTFHLGNNYSLRLPSGAHYADAVLKEQTWLPRLAPHLPLPIPSPVALGQPDERFPWHWSIYQWLPGETARLDKIEAPVTFASDIAGFLQALYDIDPADGPPGTFRGGSLDRWDQQTCEALEKLGNEVDQAAARSIWAAAIEAPFNEPPVWFHGDVAAGILLVNDQGQLSAVIDFGVLGVGDPACDMAIAWTLFDASMREQFRDRVGVSDAIWTRGKGWVLWKALIVMAGLIETNAIEAAALPGAFQALVDDWHQAGH